MDENEALILTQHASWFQRHDEVYLYQDLCGYILGMSPDIRELVGWFEEPRTRAEAVGEFGRQYPEEMLREIIETLVAHRCLVEPGSDEVAALYDMTPVKAKWRVAYTDADGRVTLVLSRTAEETPRFRELDELESRLWALIDSQRSERTLTEILAEEAGAPEDEVRPKVQRAIASWTHHDAQVVKLHEVPLSFYKGRMHALPPYLTSTMPYAPLTEATPNPQIKGPTVDLRDYHRNDIVDPALQFDEVETTLNHLLRRPHRVLEGRTYPGQMLQILVERGQLKPGARIIEVGGGTGSFAEGFLDALQREHADLWDGGSYTIVELSPALAKGQRERLARFGDRVQVISGDAEGLDLEDASVDLLIANEMIGDLRSAKVVSEELDDTGTSPLEPQSSQEAVDAIREYELPVHDAPPEFFLNLGAVRFIERIAKVLAPGATAVVTEFGEEYAYPRESTHLDHSEFSIHFGLLRLVAHRLGLEPRFEFLMDFLRLDRTAQTLATTRTYQRNLQALFGRFGRPMEKLLFTKEDLEELAGDALDLKGVEALHFDRIEDRVCGLVPHHFKILSMTRPLPN